MAKGTKTGGRTKGTRNKATYDVQKVLDKVFSKKGINLEEKLTSLLNLPMDRGVEARVLLKLMEYRYGAPQQQIAGPGKDGEHTLRVLVEHIGFKDSPSAQAN